MSFQVTRNPKPPLVSTLPTGVANGHEVYYQSTTAGSGGGASDTMSTVGAVWHLRYRSTGSGGSATYPWEFLGGGAVSHEVETLQSTASTHTTYQDLTTVGPQVIVPVAGWYRFSFSAVPSYAAGAVAALCYLKIGTAAVSSSDVLSQNNSATAAMVGGSLFREVPSAGGLTCKIQYASFANFQSSYEKRRLVVTPVRVAG